MNQVSMFALTAAAKSTKAATEKSSTAKKQRFAACTAPAHTRNVKKRLNRLNNKEQKNAVAVLVTVFGSIIF